MRRRDSRKAWPFAAALGSALVCSTEAPDDAVALRPARMNVAFSDSLFGSTNRNDAIAAPRLWGSVVGRKRLIGLPLPAGAAP